jgi:hypothetical protein
LAPTSRTSGGRCVGTVRSPTQATEFVLYEGSPRSTRPDVWMTVVVWKNVYDRKYQPYKAEVWRRYVV